MVTGWRRPRAADTARTGRRADTQPVRGIQRSFTIGRQGPRPADRVSQRQQAIDGERAPAIRDDHERTGGHDISPSGRQREEIPVLVMQMDPVLTRTTLSLTAPGSGSSAGPVLGGLVSEYERAAWKPSSGTVAEFWNPYRIATSGCSDMARDYFGESFIASSCARRPNNDELYVSD